MTVDRLKERHQELLRNRRVVDHLDPLPRPVRPDGRYHTWATVGGERREVLLGRLVEVRLRPPAYRQERLRDWQTALEAALPPVLRLSWAAGLPVTTPLHPAVFPTGALDGLCHPVPGGGALLLVDSGLLDLLRGVVKIMVAAGPEGGEPLLAGERVGYALAEAFNAHLHGNGAARPRPLPELSGTRAAVAGELWRHALGFLLAHEVAHVLRGDLVSGVRWTEARTPVGVLDARSVGWAGEHDADRLAASVLLRDADRAAPRERDERERLLVVGLLLPLFLQEAVHALAERTGAPVPFAGCHPPAATRVGVLVEHLARRVRAPGAVERAARASAWLEEAVDGAPPWLLAARELAEEEPEPGRERAAAHHPAKRRGRRVTRQAGSGAQAGRTPPTGQTGQSGQTGQGAGRGPDEG
ncbi:hypothetical protein [Actinosynnema mirum]|uniref:Uncharacterized protein n=1 Tax=Actinosynnema mirum (strain ATCC 29888 / DSM 43827 / JCM 3225 / NBRC 14064 / NCIMB 13271 / NRRL B-12336 / IMRU 3971 / 101) TaxID=446462 RepID=C6WAU8_ACTMD|nr:hypothetical protein [Actinosynnema mirum]ACU37417.1 hypothetical protein Amir_3525 [Actinosynnema mirum DSM 43827]